MENIIDHELLEAAKHLYTMPLDVVLIEWLNEAVKARKAYTFIKEKGLYSEFLTHSKMV